MRHVDLLGDFSEGINEVLEVIDFDLVRESGLQVFNRSQTIKCLVKVLILSFDLLD
jgi:hypothetical protein